MSRALILVLLLAGCVRSGVNDNQSSSQIDQRSLGMEPSYASIRMQLWVDKETACQYLVTRSVAQYDGGVTPRIAADGKTHMGCKEAK